MAKVFIIAHVPDELERAMLQYIRDFDTAHPGCHFEIGSEGPERTIAEMVEMLRVDPALTFTKIFERKTAKHTEAAQTETGESVRQMSIAIGEIIARKPIQQQGVVLADVVATWMVGCMQLAGREKADMRESMLEKFINVVATLIPINEIIYGAPTTNTKQ